MFLMLEKYECIFRNTGYELYTNASTGHKVFVKNTDVMTGVSEVSIMREIQSCYFPQLIDYALEDNRLRIAMSHIQGEKLEHSCISNTQLLHFIRQSFCALNTMHSKQILHNDIKPDNLLVDCYKNAYIVDFGSAMRFDDTKRLFGFSGNIEFCAPEVLLSPEKVDYRSDYYALAKSITSVYYKEILNLNFSVQMFLNSCMALDISKRPLRIIEL